MWLRVDDPIQSAVRRFERYTERIVFKKFNALNHHPRIEDLVTGWYDFKEKSHAATLAHLQRRKLSVHQYGQGADRCGSRQASISSPFKFARKAKMKEAILHSQIMMQPAVTRVR